MEPTDDHLDGTDAGDERPSPTRSTRKWVTTAAVATGLAVGAAGLAGAATGGSGSGATAAASGYGEAPSGPQGYGVPPGGAAGRMPNGEAPDGQAGGCDPSTMPGGGRREAELTGDTADKARAAALAEVPGATVLRLEEDSSGEATYEAHLRKSDGTMVTVLLDEDFAVISTEEGFGRGPGGPGMRGGPPPGASGEVPDDSDGATGSSTTTT
jgi:hypothetical protein